MDNGGNAGLEPRVSKLETDVLRLQQHVVISRDDAESARMLAGSHDRDIADLQTLVRAQTRVLQALRDTQIEHGQRLDALEAKVDRGFGDMQTGMAQIVALLTNRERDESD